MAWPGGEDITRLELPTRFVWGEQDRLAPSAIGKSLPSKSAMGRSPVVTDLGHMPLFAQPEAGTQAAEDLDFSDQADDQRIDSDLR